MAPLDFARDRAALVGHDEAAIFFVFQIARFAQFLDHVGDGRLLHLQGQRDVHHPGVAFALDQLVDAFEVIFGALAGPRVRRHDVGLNTVFRAAQAGAKRDG